MSDELRERIEQALARAEAATPGPWEWNGDDEIRQADTLSHVVGGNVYVHDADAAFIAAAREDVPAFARALRDVLDLHKPVRGYDRRECDECYSGPDWPDDAYPCPTIRAIAAALGEDDDPHAGHRRHVDGASREVCDDCGVVVAVPAYHLGGIAAALGEPTDA